LTKDGVTVANAISLRDSYENLGAQIVKEAAQRSSEVAGDGTTTATVLAQSILHEGIRIIGSGMDTRQVCAGIEAAACDVLENLKNTRVDIKSRQDLVSVATISANGEDKIGELIADALDSVGEEGAISIEKARGFDTSLEIVEGTVIDRGFLSPYFVTDQSKSIAELNRVLILIQNQVLSTAQSILPALEYAASNNHALLIVANDITSEALKTLVLNKMKGALSVCAIKAPEFGAARTVALQDLSSVCGGKVIAVEDTQSLHLDVASFLGYADKAIVDKNGTVLIGTSKRKKDVDERITASRKIVESAGSSDSEIAVAKRRLRRLSEGIGIIRVGGATEGEMLERCDRIDDALHSARAAKRSGIQPGGGCALVYAASNCKSKKMESESFRAGYDALLRSCKSPLKQIVSNSGGVPELVLKRIKRGKRTVGYDASNDKFGNLIEMKIVDPHLVVSSSLQHAVSVACNILLIGCAVCITDDVVEDFGLIETL
jgi:chaperonin GroEL